MNAAIQVKPRLTLSPFETEVVIDLCSQAFEEDYAPFFNSVADSVHVFASLENQIVAHALWITRWFQAGDSALLRCAYVEGVATAQAWRGRGLASAVMTHLQTAICDYDLGALSPAETTLYARCGWQYWQGPLYGRRAGEWVLIPDETAMVYLLPQTPPLDLKAPASIEWREGEVW